MFKPTPADLLTPEDRAILFQEDKLEMTFGMLIGDHADYLVMFNYEVEKYWQRRVQWELDYIA
jgi:hypothetical protein